jgi:hypothetical protein
LAAWTWGVKTGNPVRIAVTHIKPGVDHSQAEAFVDGEWTPLTEIWNGEAMVIKPYKRHFDKEPYRYVALRTWIDEQFRYVNQVN